MRKNNFIGLIFFLLLSFSAISCNSEQQGKATITTNTAETNDKENYDIAVNSQNDQSVFQDNDENDNIEIDRRYKNIDKSKLDYTPTPSPTSYCETQTSFVGTESGIPSIDNKKYQQTLPLYTYFCEVNPTKVTYEEAIKLIKSVLPDDVKELRKKYDSSTSKTYIIYSSNQGNFVVGLAFSYDESHTDNFIPDYTRNTVVGIDYMKQIN